MYQFPADPPGAGPKKDISLQDRILDAILEETGSWKVERYCEQDMAEFTNVYLQRRGKYTRSSRGPAATSAAGCSSARWYWVKGYVPTAIDGLARDASGGKLVQCGGDEVIMGSGSGIPLGGATGLEQFAGYDPDDHESTLAGIRHMEDAVKDARGIGYPPGKEFIYLQIGWTDGQAESLDALAHAGAARGLPLPAQDQGGVRPQRRRRPHVPGNAAAGRHSSPAAMVSKSGAAPGRLRRPCSALAVRNPSGVSGDRCGND